MNLIDLHETFKTDDDCLEYLAKLRWPDGIRCVTCGSDKVRQYSSPTKKQPDRKIYQCQEPSCQQQFTATAGTIFHDTHLPLTKWFMALSIIMDAKKGISAKQLQRHLKVGYKTAWYLGHRIRKAMEETGTYLLTGTVEMDETYIGGKIRGRGRRLENKDVVMGIRERRGPLRLIHVESNSAKHLGEQVRKYVAPNVERVVTDEWPAYIPAFIASGISGDRHDTIRHRDKIYVQGDIHTNTVESAFSLFKRGIIGQYHRVSIRHLQAYLNEFQWRFNRRENENRFEETLARMTQVKPMPFTSLTSQVSPSQPSSDDDPEPF